MNDPAALFIIRILCLISLVTFVLYGVDKYKAIKRSWRIPESTLLLFSLFGGIGGLLGMLVFRHKIRKTKFRILVPLFAAVQTAVLFILLREYI